MTGDDTIIDQAVAWHIASAGDDMDWDGFTAWLEADPRHRAAYDEVALGDAVLAGHGAAIFGDSSVDHADIPADPPVMTQASPPPMPANDPGTPSDRKMRRGGWRTWGSVAIAASLAAVVALPLIRAPADLVYATDQSSRTVTLPDGSTVQLAPDSRLTLDGGEMDRIALSGGALFDIRHDPDRALRIDAGGLTISDIGTRFDVQTADGDVRVAVAEGEVHVASPRLAAPVSLRAGRTLHWNRAAGRAAVEPIGISDVGSWRQGRLTYSAAPLSLVAQDLSRYAGVTVSVAPTVGDQLFSGTLAIGNGGTAVQDLSQLMGLRVARDGDGYRIEPGPR
jgi:transmembrane sensor